jgi:hypothetical protein
MQLGLRTSDGHLQFDCDLFVLPAFDVMQHQYRARARWQARDRALEVDAKRGAYAGTVADSKIGQRRVVGLQVLVVAARAQVHQRGVDCEPMQPGTERTLEAEPRKRLPRAHESFLGQFLGAGFIAANEPPDHRVHAPHVLAIQRFERSDIAARSRTHQRIVGVERNARFDDGLAFGLHGGIQHTRLDAVRVGRVYSARHVGEIRHAEGAADTMCRMDSSQRLFEMAQPAPFPIDFDPDTDEFLILPVTAGLIDDSAFLDERLDVDWAAATRLNWQDVPCASRIPNPALLFHTAFCCSTLLARSLQSPPRIVAIREPQALLRLARAAMFQPRSRIEGPLRAALHLLARPWSSGGRCLIKPTNQVNNLLPDILRLTAGKAILLRSSLPEFVISCCKKLPEADTRVRWMAQHLLKDTRLQRELEVPWNHHFHFIEACVLAWHAQIERYADALADDTADRLRSLDMQDMLDNPEGVVAACADWLELDIDASALQERVRTEFRRNAKHPERPFDPLRRAQERTEVMARYSNVLETALAWERETIAPLARLPIDWKPLVTRRRA